MDAKYPITTRQSHGSVKIKLLRRRVDLWHLILNNLINQYMRSCKHQLKRIQLTLNFAPAWDLKNKPDNECPLQSAFFGPSRVWIRGTSQVRPLLTSSGSLSDTVVASLLHGLPWGVLPCKTWHCLTGDGDGGGDFVAGPGMILAKPQEIHAPELPASLDPACFWVHSTAAASETQASLLPLANWHKSRPHFSADFLNMTSTTWSG